MIKQFAPPDFPRAAEVIRDSFSTVAKDFGITEQNCLRHTSFITTDEIQKHFDWGWLMYGLYEGNQLVGYASISKTRKTKSVYELHNLAVLTEYRHKGCGKRA